IDDEILVRRTLEAVLSAKGHVVSLAEEGENGLDQLKKAEFDLIITDLIMPGMEGLETIMAIRKRSRTARILAISGGGRGGTADFLRMARELGADEALKKPFSTDELLAA